MYDDFAHHLRQSRTINALRELIEGSRRAMSMADPPRRYSSRARTLSSRAPAEALAASLRGQTVLFYSNGFPGRRSDLRHSVRAPLRADLDALSAQSLPTLAWRRIW